VIVRNVSYLQEGIFFAWSDVTRTIHPFSWAGKKSLCFCVGVIGGQDEYIYVRKIWGRDGSDYEDYYLLGCYAL
jgi:hypothetical protein